MFHDLFHSDGLTRRQSVERGAQKLPQFRTFEYYSENFPVHGLTADIVQFAQIGNIALFTGNRDDDFAEYFQRVTVKFQKITEKAGKFRERKNTFFVITFIVRFVRKRIGTAQDGAIVTYAIKTRQIQAPVNAGSRGFVITAGVIVTAVIAGGRLQEFAITIYIF
jgi:hypothetical protein